MGKTPVLHIDNKDRKFNPNTAFLTRGDGVVIHADTSIPGLAPTWEIYSFYRVGEYDCVVVTGECGCP
jgi:hypothetical protein